MAAAIQPQDSLGAPLAQTTGLGLNGRRAAARVENRVKHLEKAGISKITIAKANVYDDIGNGFHDLGDNNKRD